jgi:hypothetical protein
MLISVPSSSVFLCGMFAFFLLDLIPLVRRSDAHEPPFDSRGLRA